MAGTVVLCKRVEDDICQYLPALLAPGKSRFKNQHQLGYTLRNLNFCRKRGARHVNQDASSLGFIYRKRKEEG